MVGTPYALFVQDEKICHGIIVEVGPDTSIALATGGFRAATHQRIPRQLDVIKHHIEAWD